MGFGDSPFGSGPYGLGTPATPPTPAPQMYADPVTGQIGSGRLIDPVTRQYAIDASGNTVGQGTVPQLVQLAYATVQGSSILASLGETFREVQVIGDGFVQTITDKAIAPVQGLVDQKLVAVLGVDVKRIGDSGVSIAVRWRDLSTNIEGTQTL
jgi:hypothetical protein